MAEMSHRLEADFEQHPEIKYIKVKGAPVIYNRCFDEKASTPWIGGSNCIVLFPNLNINVLRCTNLTCVSKKQKKFENNHYENLEIN